MWLLLSTASAADLPALAKQRGVQAVREEVAKIVAEAKSPKKATKALEAAGLAGVKMPAKAILGAELAITELSGMAGCTWGGSLACTMTAKAAGHMKAEDYELVCTTKFGASYALTAAPERGDGDHIAWAITGGVEKCWELGGNAIVVRPVSSDALEGVGEGTDLIPPELAALSWEQVYDTIHQQDSSFRHCYQKFEEHGRGGKLEVDFTIADDGSIAKAEAKPGSTFQDQAVVDCILDRFRRIQLPPPQGGFTQGTYPFSVQ